MNIKAKIEFAFPQNNKSGTSINSRVFIVAITRICVAVFSRVLMPFKIQTVISVSESPIKIVSSRECSLPKIFATISSCRGTRLSTLQKSPLATQTVAMKYVRILWMVLSFISSNQFQVSCAAKA